MTTKTRNVVIIIALLLITFSFILSTTLYAEANEDRLINWLAERIDELFGRVERLGLSGKGQAPELGLKAGIVSQSRWTDSLTWPGIFLQYEMTQV